MSSIKRAGAMGLVFGLGSLAGVACAQAYPTKALRIIVPFPPGAATDTTARYLAQKLGEGFGQQVIVDNRPGANGTLGLDLAAKAAPDGHTLVIGQTGNLAISPHLAKVPYDSLRDFAPVSMLISSPHVVAVHPALPVRSFKALIDLARARPDQLNYASTGSGSAGHLGVELLKRATGIQMMHVPYKGAVAGFTDLVAGHVVVMFTSVMSTHAFSKAGKVRLLAVASTQRSPTVAEVPTIAESGYPGFEVSSWWGLLGPAATPREIVGRLNGEVVRIMSGADARDRLGSMGADLGSGTPEQLAAYIRSEHAKWAQAVKVSGARVD
ncbi:MAG: tripartite tricarboxylate transporter substrate binding protein [Burkholderiales bacterium]|nr:tripartite tricarboxylate transporter substrate binding protein [Burkholderiales bacterium]